MASGLRLTVSKPKYRNRAVGGYSSAKEARRAQELKLLAKAGKISDLREQVPFVLIPGQKRNGAVERPCRYVADFTYLEPGPEYRPWATVVEDCKGYRTPEYKIKRKLMLWVHGIVIRET